MKLTGTAATRFLSRPEPDRAGILIYGPDAMRVALRRQELVAALIGPNGESEMRLTRIAAGDLRRDATLAVDAMREQGFFPGPRVVLVEDATDTLARPLSAALDGWEKGDAMLVVTAGNLGKGSALRKLFEPHPNAYACAIYDDPPGRDEIERILADSGLKNISAAAMEDIIALSRMLDPGDFRQTVEKIALYKLGDDTPLGSDDIAACVPATIEAELDDVLHAAAEGRTDQIGPLMRRLEGQGINPVTLSIAAMRHFRALHVVAAAPGGPSEGIARLRPPVFGPRRDRMLRQAQRWGVHRLESALQALTDADLTLRSASRAPAMAVIERALLRLAALADRR
ncbi:DNA polymerase III subunit delta [Albidovulum inexpectatum]|uniref:DNA polymerase III subunit delta n=1 Tax=Albidovulum inexpectatum TaxID=196587 RepID=UPI000CE48D1F|nr:DNA polymerase III subunit delta [Albidovulum inexpectatum]